MRSWRNAVERAIFGSTAYSWTLRGSTPKALAAAPFQPWLGDASHGVQILKGNFVFHGEAHGADGMPWRSDQRSADWRVTLHGFTWLGSLHAVGSDASRRCARDLVAHWIDHNSRWDPLIWRADVLATRIIAWIGEHEFLCGSASDEFRALYFRSLARQVRHLFRIGPGPRKGASRFTVLKALVYAAVSMPGLSSRLERIRKQLGQEIRQQILADGGHIERNPSVHLGALRTLVDIRASFTLGGYEIPDVINSAIARMASALRALRHGDGRLALFNGSREEASWLIDAALAQADSPGRAPDELRHAGFQRLRAGRTLILVDAASPPPPGFDGGCHAGTLSFEMAVGKERLIVNCGSQMRRYSRWRDAQRATAAHSTLVVADTNSSEIRIEGGLGRRPRHVTLKRDSEGGATLLDLSHDGYRESHGVMHRRRLYLASNGYDVRGEDSVIGAQGRDFDIRFHLHPSVQRSLLGGGSAVLLRLPSGEGWRFDASGASLRLEESFYLGDPDEPRRTEQIVLTGRSGAGGDIVKWALNRVGNQS